MSVIATSHGMIGSNGVIRMIWIIGHRTTAISLSIPIYIPIGVLSTFSFTIIIGLTISSTFIDLGEE